MALLYAKSLIKTKFDKSNVTFFKSIYPYHVIFRKNLTAPVLARQADR